jgi:N-acetylglucosaminyl-diphospho-decaprenol L-rhamnosyltransferase
VSFNGSIVIVNFNSGTYLAACLESIRTYVPTAHAIVVDNASVDGSERAAASGLPQVELLRNGSNMGFGSGVNQGLARTSGATILLLNPDCRLLPESIDPLVAELAQHPECAIAGPQILNDDGSVQGSARGDPTLLTGLFGRSSLLTRLFPRSSMAQQNVRVDLGRGGASYEVDWVSGACMLARRDALTAVGGFDERYFLYWEDADLCRRLRDRGGSIRYVPAARVTHSVGQSSRSDQVLATRAFHRSAYLYYSTHVARTRLAQLTAWLLLTLRCRWKLLSRRS